MPNAHPLSEMQVAKIAAATHLFESLVGNKAATERYQHALTEYVSAHPTWSITESAITIADRALSRPNYQPRGGDAAGSETDLNFSLRGEFQNQIASAIAGDPTVARLQRAEQARTAERWNKIEGILSADPLINQQMAIVAMDRIRTRFNNDEVEAVALAHAVNTLVHTTGISGGWAAIENGENPLSQQGRNAGRYQEAKEDVIAALRSHGISNPQEADVTTIMNEAVPIAREAIARHASENHGSQR